MTGPFPFIPSPVGMRHELPPALAEHLAVLIRLQEFRLKPAEVRDRTSGLQPEAIHASTPRANSCLKPAAIEVLSQRRYMLQAEGDSKVQAGNSCFWPDATHVEGGSSA